MDVAAEKKHDKETNDERQKRILDFAEAWKKMYFESETTLAKAIDEYVAGDSFTSFLEKMGAEYLSLYKTNNQNMERFFANSPVPTKKDIARVAELVIALEEKLDDLDMQMSEGLNNLATSVMKLVDFQMVLKDELLSLRQEVQMIQKQLESKQPTQVSGELQPPTRNSWSRKVQDNNETGNRDDLQNKSNTENTVGNTARPRNKKNPDKA